MNSPVKVNFRVEQDSDGYPPVSVESLWAKPVGSHFEIDSVPFFTREATVADLVRAVPDSSGTLWFDGIEHRSLRSLIRVVFFERDCQDLVATRLRELGCSVERMTEFNLLAVDVPSEVDLGEVQWYLGEMASAGRLDYEEAILRA
jgi:hypothetical protein